MFLKCSSNVPSMFLKCSFNVPQMFLQCSLAQEHGREVENDQDHLRGGPVPAPPGGERNEPAQ
eukprot:896138-Prorocentrum_minimum.AAC.1